MDTAKEGTLYRSITVCGKTFDIYYGYYSESERGRWGPIPIFPDFKTTPHYTDDGMPYVRADQDICTCFLPKPKISGEGWCNDCKHFTAREELIGVCECKELKVMLRKCEENTSEAFCNISKGETQ